MVGRKTLSLAVLLLVALSVVGGCRGAQTDDDVIDEGFVSVGNRQKGPLPGLELVDPASVADPTAISPGVALDPGTYVVVLSGDSVASAQWEENLSLGLPALTFQFDQAGTSILSEWTTGHVGDALIVVFDGKVIMAPQINEPIVDGSLMISTDEASGLDPLKSVVPLKE